METKTNNFKSQSPVTPAGNGNRAVAPGSDFQELVEASNANRPWVVLLVIVIVAIIAAATVSFVVYGGHRTRQSDSSDPG